MNQSCKLYRKQCLLALGLYAIVLLLSIDAISKFHLGWWRIPVALVPVLPCLLVVRSMLAFFSRCDELQIRIHLQSLAFAFACTAILTLTYGFLQNVGFPNVNWAWVWPLMGTLWLLGQLFAKRKYQ
ncbi:MAG: hypothetical protein ACRD28_00690 [Acidobacteriaceae bacterium]